MTLAIDLDVFNVGSTPLQMLLVVLILTVLVGLVIMIVTQIFSPYLNRRWPATAPLSPTELLWGEAGGHVKRTFRGLDLEEQKDIASQLNERKVAAGAPITSQGDPATAFYLLKSGTAEAVQVDARGGERRLREYAEGDSFGEVAILERSPRTATVRAAHRLRRARAARRGLRGRRRADRSRRQRLHGRRAAVPRRRPRTRPHRGGRAGAQPRAADPAVGAERRARAAPAPGSATVSFEVASAAAAAAATAPPAPPAAPGSAAGNHSVRLPLARRQPRRRGCLPPLRQRQQRGRGDRSPGAATRSCEPRAARDPRASSRRARMAGQPPRRLWRRSRAHVRRSQRASRP